jgi:hypothetical protein
MRAAKLVGPAGEVLGVERDARSMVRARQRVAAADYRNVSFVESLLRSPATGRLMPRMGASSFSLSLTPWQFCAHCQNCCVRLKLWLFRSLSV